MRKKLLKTNVSIVALAIAFGSLTTFAAKAEDIPYTGSDGDYSSLVVQGSKTYLYPHDSVSGNNVTLSNTSTNNDDYKAPNYVYGGTSTQNDVINNTVNLTGGKVLDIAYGGSSGNGGSTLFNQVVISGTAQVDGSIYGGFVYSGAGIAKDNIVDVQGGYIGADVDGGVSNQASAISNTVRISAGSVLGNVEGGYTNGNTDNGNVSDANANKVILTGGVVQGAVRGGWSSFGNTSQNSVTMSAGTVTQEIHGGHSAGAGKAIGNKVAITSGTAQQTITGGWSISGGATGNHVDVSGNAATASILGGYADVDGDVRDNTVKISGESQIGDLVFGGFVKNGSGNALNNGVVINGGNINSQVAGGRSVTGAAQENTVSLTAGTVNGIIYGGYVAETGLASKNTVTISGGKAEQRIFGGFSNAGNATANDVSISAGTMASDVIGGYAADKGDVKDNVVIISGTTQVGGTVHGGYSINGNAINNISQIDGGTVAGQIFGGRTTTGSATGNSISVSAGIVQANLYGGAADGAGLAASNRVTVTGGEIGKEVIGGWSDSGEAKANRVELSNATVAGDVTAGYVDKGGSNAVDNVLKVYGEAHLSGNAVGGYTNDGDAIRNTVSVVNATVDAAVAGGSTHIGIARNNSVTLSDNAYVKGVVVGGDTAKGDSIENSVFLENASVDGNVYGGVTNEGSVTGNNVTLAGGNIKIGGMLYGGYDKSATGDVFTGNTLTLNGFRGDLVGIKNFQNYNWILPKDVVNGETLIHITGTEAVDLQNTIHTIAFVSDGNRLAVGDQVTLIDKVVNTPDSISMEVKQGQFIIYDMRAKQTDQDTFVLTAYNKTVTPEPIDTKDIGTLIDGNGNLSKDTPKLAGRINPQSKAFSEGRAAALGFATQGADLIADTGIRAAQSSVAAASSHITQMNLVPFLVVSGSSSRYKTGSHVDVDGFNMAAGLATGFELAGVHQVTVGAFFEYGRGTYDSYNSFASYASVHGDGDTHYTGGGILGRIDFAGTGLGRVTNLAAGQTDGLYLDAAFRAGKIDTDFDSNDLIDANGVAGSYDSGANYFGAHGSVGYVFNFDDRNSVDVYGRYLWTRVDSETVDVGTERLHFDSTNSSRIRVGTRYSYIYSEQIKPYVGAAYEHEFDGEVKAQAYGLKLDKPSLDGDTGIFEAGISFKPIRVNQALSVDVSGQGFVGQREGGGGGMKIKYEF